MEEQAILLTDAEMQHFITDGYLILDSGLPSALHEQVDSKLGYILKKEGNPGNNILPAVPEMHAVLDSPRVRGALQSVLGKDYLLHPHRFAHNIEPAEQSEGEYKIGRGSGSFVGWHQDSHSPLSRPRHHLLRYAMILYYPQDTPIEMGPTQLIPGTHRHSHISEADKQHGFQAAGRAGTCVLVHFDIVHGGSMNFADRSRYMVKFVFARATDPKEPSWKSESAEWHIPQEAITPFPHSPASPFLWQWLRGETPTPRLSEKSIEELTAALNGEEPARQEAIYGLAGYGEKAVPTLIAELASRPNAWTESAVVMENTAYALAAMGSPAIPSLISLLTHQEEWVVVNAAFGLGEMGERAKEAVPALISLLEHPAHPVVRTALDALGQIRIGTRAALPQIRRLLTQENPEWGTKLYRSWTGQNQVRMNAIMALIRMGEEAEGAEEWLGEVLDDPCGYVGGWGIEFLQRLNTPESLKVANQFLYRHRWDNSLNQGIRTY
jgi:HEAT repeat protein